VEKYEVKSNNHSSYCVILMIYEKICPENKIMSIILWTAFLLRTLLLFLFLLSFLFSFYVYSFISYLEN
jgi:hypothetical protein